MKKTLPIIELLKNIDATKKTLSFTKFNGRKDKIFKGNIPGRHKQSLLSPDKFGMLQCSVNINQLLCNGK